MKLELNHLIPYSQHKLNVVYGGISCELEGIDFSFKNIVIVERINMSLDEIKPILRPLSEYCGKTTAGEVMKKLNCSMRTVHQIWDLDTGTLKLDDISLETYNTMCKNHIDFNKLINAGLAKDINTL